MQESVTYFADVPVTLFGFARRAGSVNKMNLHMVHLDHDSVPEDVKVSLTVQTKTTDVSEWRRGLLASPLTSILRFIGLAFWNW